MSATYSRAKQEKERAEAKPFPAAPVQETLSAIQLEEVNAALKALAPFGITLPQVVREFLTRNTILPSPNADNLLDVLSNAEGKRKGTTPQPSIPTHPASLQLPREAWDFSSVPDNELWAALIWEYGKDAKWTHAKLPQYDLLSLKERTRQINKFHEGNSPPSTALKLLNKMRLWQWSWSENSGVEHVDFFSRRSLWLTLSAIVNVNMRRALEGLEPAADLPKLHAILTSPSNDIAESNEAARIIEILFAIEPRPASIQEVEFSSQPQQWLPGGNGLDDVSEGVIKGEQYLFRLRQAMSRLLTGKLSPQEAPEQLQRASSGEISLSRFRDNDDLKSEGFFAVAFRGNWRLGKIGAAKKFEQWWDDHLPSKFRARASGQRASTHGPQGIELRIRNGKPLEPQSALNALGTLRRVTAMFGNGRPDWTSYSQRYHPNFSDKDFNIKNAQIAGSKECKLAREILEELFPNRRKSGKKLENLPTT